MVLWTIPTFGILISSFRPEIDVKTTGWWTFFTTQRSRSTTTGRCCRRVPAATTSAKFFINSLIITIPSVDRCRSGIALLAAYAFSWMKFKGRDWLFVAVVAMLMVPLQMALMPMLQLFTGGAHIGTVTIFPDLNLTGTYLGVWIAHICLRHAVLHLHPQELRRRRCRRDIIEAAQVDGAGHLTIFARLIVPLSVPAIASLAIFQFMWIWNDYLIALIFAGSATRRRSPPSSPASPAPAASRGTCSPLPAWCR